MDEETWIAAMRADPSRLDTMAAFSDWLQEQGDPRWKPLAWLVEHGKTGHFEGATGDESGYWTACGEPQCRLPKTCADWCWRAFESLVHDYSLVARRMALLNTWLPGDTNRG